MADTSKSFQKFIPGQILKMRIHDEFETITDSKPRPYLIIGAIKRRLTLLKMTSRGDFSSNWIYTFENDDGTTSKVILDCPIVINVRDIKNIHSSYFMKRQEFIKVMQHYLAAVVHQSTYEDVLLSESSIVDIQTEVALHDETMYSFSRYGTADEIDSPIKIIPERITDKTNVTVDDTAVNTQVEEITDTSDDIVEEVEYEDDIEEGDEDDEDSDKKRSYHFKKTTLSEISVEDLIIFGEGSTTLDEINRVCEQFGIKNAKFELSNLCMRNKCAYVGGKYNFTLKQNYNKSKGSKKKNRNFGKVKRYLLNDTDKYGAAIAASIWGSTPSTIYYYTKSNKKK